jgi:hypothetical protein
MLRKILPVLVVVFLGFWLFTDPHGLAHATRSSAGGTWSLGTQLFSSLIMFFRAL